ncbi:MAG TPA: type II secretion system F family protein, partial [Nocardioides sp.]
MTTTYSYKVRDNSGSFREGKVDAASEAAVADKLRAMGFHPLEVKEANTGMQREVKLGRKKKI